METFWDIINVLAVIGVWIFVIWFGASLKNLKSITDSLKGVFDSMKSSSEYLAKVQSTAQKLYDPDEVEKVVNLRVQARELEFQENLKQLKKETKQEHETKLKQTTEHASATTNALSELLAKTINTKVEPYMRFSAYAALKLKQEDLDSILEIYKDPEIKADVSEFVGDLRGQVFKLETKTEPEH